MISLVLTCAGNGTRAGFSNNKLLQKINGKTVVETTFTAFKNTNFFDEIIVTASEIDAEIFAKILPSATIVLGGKTRFLSVKNALSKVRGDIVLVHDGARPFTSKKVISDCIETAKKYGSAICAVPQTDTIAKAENDEIISVLGKDNLYSIQTPQGFNTTELKKAFSLATRDDYPDESSIYSEFIKKPRLSQGEKSNIKLTFMEDFSPILDMRTGVGFDCHKLVSDRALILGGVTIKHDKGLLGHSDADVLTHAIMDAILSSLSLRDIGYHFPDSDEKYKGACSMDLLKKVLELIDEKNYKVYQVSACIMAEKPKLLPHIPLITSTLAKALNINDNMLGISATTLEGLGFVGREEGICVHATATLINK